MSTPAHPDELSERVEALKARMGEGATFERQPLEDGVRVTIHAPNGDRLAADGATTFGAVIKLEAKVEAYLNA